MRFRKILFFSFVFAVLLSTCRIREVEPPDNSTSDWISPTDYQILLSNLSLSINQRNIQNYLRCFKTDSLTFVPSTVTYTGNQTLWDNWNWQDEQTWFTNVSTHLGITTGNYLALEETDLQNVTSDSLRYIGNYTLVMNHTDTSLTVTFKGQMEVMCRINEFNEWQIWRWKDYETNVDSCWSRLKLKYVQ